MERNYTKEELSKFKIPQLKDILRNRKLKVSGKKQELIDRILADQGPEVEELTEKVEELSIQDPFALLALPKDVQRETLLKLNYKDIAKMCSTNKELSNICQDDRFWQAFAERRELKKDLPTDTWKQTAILDYLGKENYSDPNKNYILGKISWDISVMPKNTPNEDRLDIEKNRWNKYGILSGGNLPPLPPEMVGIAISYFDENLDKMVLLSEKDLKKIVFRGPVKIGVPFYDEIRNEWIVDEYEYIEKYDYEINVFILQPNTPVGSTVGHVLEQIYRHMFGFKANEPLKSIAEISANPDFYVSHSYFEGLEKPSQNRDYYEILLGS